MPPSPSSRSPAGEAHAPGAIEPIVRPFAALRPPAERAGEVAAPPYDVLSSAEARAYAEGRRWSFLHVSKAEIDLAPEINVYAPEVYQQAGENLRRMIEAGVLRRDAQAGYYIYRVRMGDHVQTGIAVAASITAYVDGRIKRHELTRPDKEDDRVRQIEAVGAHTGPVFTMHEPDAELGELIAGIAAGAPEMSVTLDNGVEHAIWPVFGAETIDAISRRFARIGALYIADGHHRSAAALRVMQARRAANPAHTGDETYNSFLAVSFPADEVQILDYNRVVRDLNGLSADDFLARIADRFEVTASAGPVKPAAPRTFGMYLAGRWYRLVARQAPDRGPIAARLDISLLSAQLLEPVLGIGDPRLDARIDFIGGIRGLGELEARVDSGDWAVAFSLYPTSVAELIAVADAGEIMPPKSTWFEPKLADGLVSLPLD